jgi:hypothetical protein
MLLRHYASNLRRSWRNTPHAAFVDATFQVEAAIAVYLICPCGLLYLLLSRTIFRSLAPGLHGHGSNGVILMVLPLMVIMWLVDQRFRRYESIPGIAAEFDTAGDRKLVYLLYGSGFAVIGLALLVAYFINKSFPLSSN